MKNKIRVATEEELRESDVIICLSFGTSGFSNEHLAEIARNLYEKYKLPLILQWEIAMYFTILGVVKATIQEHREYKKNGKTKKYLDTFEVLDQAKEICDNEGWRKAILVAHQAHLPRVIKTAEKLGFIVRAPSINKVPYDKKSAQIWTKGRLRFAVYEKLATFIYSRKGKI